MRGWIVSNGGLRQKKFTEQLDWMAHTLREAGVEAVQLCNQELTPAVLSGSPCILCNGHVYGTGYGTMRPDAPWKPSGLEVGSLPDFVLFWDKDVRLAAHMEQAGFRLFNSARTIADCDDKSATHRILSGHGIPMPDTLVAPFYYPGLVPEDDPFVRIAAERLGYPMVVKESYGSFGAQVYLAENAEMLSTLHTRLAHVPHICQRFVQSSRGRDVRLQVVGERVVAAMFRHSETDFRANVSAGGSMDPFDPPESFSRLAVRASQLLGADFAGVDLLFDENDGPLVCEVNSNAHMRNIHTCTGVDVPRQITEWILFRIGRKTE